MTTRLELRTGVRRRLEDTGGGPLWDDAALNDFLGEAVRRYGARFPREVTTGVIVDAGETSVEVTPAIEGERVIHVFDQLGEIVPRHSRFEPDGFVVGLASGPGQTWRWWSSTLILARAAAESGTWTIEHLAGRTLPTDDVTAVEIVPGDEEIVVLLAVAVALRRRVVEDGKRGLGLGRGRNAISLAAQTAQSEAERMMTGRRRRVHAGWL